MANCQNTKTGNDPLFNGIMAPIPEPHLALGIEVASTITRISPTGQPAGNGRIVMAGLGMSNAKQQFAGFMNAYRLKYGRKRPTTTVNLGTGNWDLSMMVDSAAEYRSLLLSTMVKKKVTPAQVQIVIYKNSVRHQDKPYPHDVNEYVSYLEKYKAFLVDLFPNLKMWFVLAPIYSGYAAGSAPRKEPFVHREGIAVKEFVERHYGQAGPWIGLGPYYWSDGLRPRTGDSLIWRCEDFQIRDGVHPSTLGIAKTTDMLMRFFENSPVTGWFKAG